MNIDDARWQQIEANEYGRWPQMGPNEYEFRYKNMNGG